MNEKGRQTKLLAAVAVFAMVICALAVVMPSAEESYGVEAPADEVQIGTSDELTEAMNSGDGTVYSLIDDITVTGVVNVTKANVTLYLNGHSITSTSTAEGSVFDLVADSSTQFTINGTGSIVNSVTGSSSCIIDVRSGDTLTLSENVTLTSGGYGIGAWTGSTVVVNNATIRAEASAISGNGTNNDANVTINGGSFTSINAAAIYFPSSEKLDINGGTFKGKMGIEARAGTITIDGATITATGALTENKEGTSGPLAYGMAVAIIDHSSYSTTTNTISLTIGSDVVLNGASYDVYVGNLNGSNSGTSGTFNTTTVGSQMTYDHTVTLNMPGLSKTFFGTDYRFAATDVTGTSFTIVKDYVFSGTVSFNETGSVDVKNIVAGTDGVTFSQGSVVISGTLDATSSAVTITAEGQVLVDGLTVEGNGITVTSVNDGDATVTIRNLTIPDSASVKIEDGATVVIPEGTTFTGDITNAGTLRVLGTASGVITNNNVMSIGTNGSASNVASGSTGKTVADSALTGDNTGFIGRLNFDLVINTGEYLSGSYIISEGYSITIRNGGSLNLNGFSLVVEGDLIIENGGSISGIGGTKEGILLTSSGTITNSGVIGKGTTDVKVYANTDGTGTLEGATEAGSVTLKNVTGISFGLDRTVTTGVDGTRTVTYDLTFSGNAVRNGTGTHAISANGAIVDGDLTIGNSITFTATDVEVSGSSTVDVNGTIGGSVVLENGAIINLNGTTDETDGVEISAKTGIYQSNQSTNISTLLGTTEVTVINVTGVSFEVTSTSYMVEEVSMTEQRLVMSGSASRTTVSEGISTHSITIGGTDVTGAVPVANKYIGVFVTGEFYYPQDTRAVTLEFQSSAKITVTGQLSSDNPIITTTNASRFVGTAYSTGTGSSEMFYVTGFEQAYGQIANANSQTITVYGALEISTEVVIASGQTLDISNAAGVVDITSTGDVEISNGGNVVGTINDVDGVLTVIYGGVCNPPTTYDVRTTNDNNDVTYSGLAYALDNATEGQTINLVGNATVTSLTVPAGITLDVNEGASLAVERNLTVNGTLNNHGTVDVGRDVTVSGTMDTTEGTFTANGTGYTITVTGVLTMPAGTTVTSAKYNGTSYTNDEGYVVVTSLASAIADIADYDIKPTLTMYGRVPETGGFDVSSNVSIASGAQITIDSLTLSGCQLSVASNATFTGSVSGQSGEDGSTVTSTVELNRISDLTVANSSARNAANVTVWTTSVTTTAADEALVGKITVSAGTVTLGSDMTVNDDSNQEPSMTVSSGATFVIPGDYTLTSNDGISFEGTVTVNGTFTADGAAVSGTMDIADGGVVNVIDMSVTGTVNVSATEGETGTLNVGVASSATKGVLTIGEQPETLGQTTTGSISGKITFVNGYVRAYSGADMSAATYDEGDGVSTAYNINDALYMTVYAAQNGGIGIANVGSNAAEAYDIAGYDVPSPLEWHAGDRTVGTETIGHYDAVSATFTASYANGTISVGTGLTMYIDGLTVSNFQQTIGGEFGYYLTVGNHTVTIAADANYNADQATITFNGQTIQNGGTITVTPEMVQDGFVLSATGAAPSTPGDITVNTGSGDMSLTDILLIVLVILILVMAIIVALRLMRS